MRASACPWRQEALRPGFLAFPRPARLPGAGGNRCQWRCGGGTKRKLHARAGADIARHARGDHSGGTAPVSHRIPFAGDPWKSSWLFFVGTAWPYGTRRQCPQHVAKRGAGFNRQGHLRLPPMAPACPAALAPLGVKKAARPICHPALPGPLLPACPKVRPRTKRRTAKQPP